MDALGRACRTAALAAALLCTPAGVAQPGVAPPPSATVHHWIPIGTPLLLEGTLTDVDPIRRTVTVLGVRVRVPTTASVSSPSTSLVLGDLVGLPLPGRTEPGFVGGTAIVVGAYDATGPVAATIKVERAENVLEGPVSPAEPGSGAAISIAGRPVIPLRDPRMPAREINEVGFAVDAASTPAGTPATASGYAIGGVFYAYEIVSDGATVLPRNQTLVTRSSCAPGGSLDVRGACTAMSGSVRLFDADSGMLLGSGTVLAEGTYATYRVRVEHVAFCPTRVRVVSPDGSHAESVVPTP